MAELLLGTDVWSKRHARATELAQRFSLQIQERVMSRLFVQPSVD